MEQMNLSETDKEPEDYVMNIGEFHYELFVGEIFTIWYARNRDVCENRMARLPDETRIDILLWKFSQSDHDLYLAYLPPLSAKDLTFEGTVEKCKVFGDNTFLFDRRLKCLNLVIRKVKDTYKYTEIVNRMCNAFSYGSLKEDLFRRFVFIHGLRSACHEGIRLKLLSLLDKNLDLMLHHLVDKYNNFRSLIADSNAVGSNETQACLER
ncbi:unnamed protein product [Hymenolepis diminuta]|uniref:UDENN domain-containing protein n=1 Tax=Hymenolepis diminuta TaxID=6216 RepID=A0A0R3SRR1_HYMDI|nr:unnamed protein product [Hymenolepis diminuta]